MIETLSWLWSTSGFMPRSTCGQWTPIWRAFAITTDLLYGLAYLIIPIFLLSLWRARRHDLKGEGLILIVFALFIAGCGISHFTQIAVWWYPAYRLFILMSLPGAILSIFCVGLMPWTIWYWRHVPTLEQTVAKNRELAQALKEVEQENEIRTRAIEKIEDAMDKEVWEDSQARVLLDLERALRGLKD